MRIGPDIEKEFKDEIESLNKFRFRRKLLIQLGLPLIFFGTIIVQLLFTREQLSFPFFIVSLIIFGMILGIFFKIKIKTKIGNLLAYYLFVISICLEKLDFENPSSIKNFKDRIKQIFHHINRYLDDYEGVESYYRNFDFIYNLRKKLDKLQSILKKMNTLIEKKKFIEKERISDNLMKMAHEILKNSDLSEEFDEYLNNISEILEGESETEFGINIKKFFMSVYKAIPSWILYIIAFLIVSLIIYFIIPLGAVENKWFAILMVGAGFLVFFKK